MPRTAYGRAPESRPTVTVPEALCTSVEEVSNRDQATNFLHRKVILLVNKLRLQQVQGDPRVITDWWFPMVTTKDSFTGATMGGDTKAPLKAFATHLDLTIDEYKKLIDLCNQPWRSLKKNHGILSETRRYQHIQWILFDEIMMESKISPTDQVSGKHPPPQWIKCSSNEVINTVSRREFEEECSKRGEKRRIEMNEKQCEIQVEKMKTRQNANRWKEVTLANRPNEVYRIPTNYTLILIGKLNAMSSNLAYERMKNIRLSARSNELQQHARLLQNKLEATENTILEMRHHQDEATRLLHNDIMELHDQLIANEEANKEAVSLGRKLLSLKRDDVIKCPVTPRGQHLYGMAWANLPKAAAKSLSQFIPIAVAAFLSDLGIDDEELLMCVADITPCDKTLSKSALMLHQQVYACIAEEVNRGTMFALGHDKGERHSLGRLIRQLAFLQSTRVLQVNVDANGVVSNDESIGEHIRNTFMNVEPYIEEGKKIVIGTITTDAGGGGGTLESSASKIDDLLYDIYYIINCALHSHSKCLQNAWEKSFGKGGLQQITLLQLLHSFWSLQEALGEHFKKFWSVLIQREWIQNILPKPILTRWGYVLDAATSIEEYFEEWETLTSHCYELWDGEEKMHTIAKGALKVLKNKVVKVQLHFICAFGKVFWTKHFNWLKRINPKSGLSGHSSHEMCVQVFLMQNELILLIASYKTMDAFSNFKAAYERLEEDSDKCLIDKQIFTFFKVYKTVFQKTRAGFNRWQSSLLPFVVASSNTEAVTVFIDTVLEMSEVPGFTANDIHPGATTSNNEIHSLFKLQDWKDYLNNDCKINVEDRLLVKHRDALIELSRTKTTVWDLTDNASVISLREDCNNIIIPSYHHSQNIEAGVQETSICTDNQKSEQIASALVAARSYDNVAVNFEVHQYLSKRSDLKANQHMSGGSNDNPRTLRSAIAIRKQARLEEAGHTNYESRQQATKYRAKLFVKRAFNEPFKDPDKMRKQVNHIRKNDHMTAKKLRQQQKINDLEKRIDKRTNNTRANRRQACNLSGAPMTIPLALDNKMLIKNFSAKTRLPALQRELTIRDVEFLPRDNLKTLKILLRTKLGATSDDHEFELLHPENDATEIIDL